MIVRNIFLILTHENSFLYLKCSFLMHIWTLLLSHTPNKLVVNKRYEMDFKYLLTHRYSNTQISNAFFVELKWIIFRNIFGQKGTYETWYASGLSDSSIWLKKGFEWVMTVYETESIICFLHFYIKFNL